MKLNKHKRFFQAQL